ncbi:MAG: hypothetical protein IPK13_04200 [Deltaproteobacteria bacterium]|nr:hypothetical protein [Deltaproteobacteria bacterium]
MLKDLTTITLIAVAPLLLVRSAEASPELKPFQEEAKADFDEAMAEPLKAANEACGLKLTVTSEYEKFDAKEWSGRAHYSWCVPVLEQIKSLCEKRPAYKKVLVKKLKSVSCVFSGVKPAEKKDGSSDFTIRNMEFKGSAFVFHMATNQANVGDSAKTVLEKALNE